MTTRYLVELVKHPEPLPDVANLVALRLDVEVVEGHRLPAVSHLLRDVDRSVGVLVEGKLQGGFLGHGEVFSVKSEEVEEERLVLKVCLGEDLVVEDSPDVNFQLESPIFQLFRVILVQI